MTLTEFLQVDVRPDRPKEPEGHRDEKHQPPVDRAEDPAEDEANECSTDSRHVVDTERQSALVRRECVGQDRGRIGDQESRADPLKEASDDQPKCTRLASQWIDREHQRGGGVDDESEVVHLYPAVHVAEPSETHDQHTAHDQETEDHPEQVEAVTRSEGVQLDPTKDVGHGDQHDR